LILFSLLYTTIIAQGFTKLSDRTANHIIDFFKDKHNVRFAINKFDNFTELTDLGIQKFYQLLLSQIEKVPKIEFNDLLISFSKNKGQFNLNRLSRLTYLIYLKLIRNKNKLGVGIVIYSRVADKIVSIKYIEEIINEGDKNILNTIDYGFRGSGFSKIIDIKVYKNLLDCQTIKDSNDDYKHFFFYPNKIETYKIEENSLKRYFSFQIKWGRPYYPVLEYEGKLSCWLQGKTIYVTAGANFSSHTKVFTYYNGEWKEIKKIDFVPFKNLQINNETFLAGARYETGKNYFKNELLFVSIDSEKFAIKNHFRREVPEFYSLAFSKKNGNLDSIHLIDRDYKYHFFTSNLEKGTTSEKLFGSSLSSMQANWLAISDYSKNTDRLYFFKIENGIQRFIYENKINGEIIFISDGTWKLSPGFWVYVKLSKRDINSYRLQFWSKMND